MKRWDQAEAVVDFKTPLFLPRQGIAMEHS